MEVKEVSQAATPPPAVEAHPDGSVQQLQVGNSISSVHVNYNYFEVGTGQVERRGHGQPRRFPGKTTTTTTTFKKPMLFSSGVCGLPLSGF